MTRVLIAYTDTGGGHRAATAAICDALREADTAVEIACVDPFALDSRWPWRHLGAAYAWVVQRAPWCWRIGFRLTDSPRVARVLQQLAWPFMRRPFRDAAAHFRPDVVISTHPLLTRPLQRVFRGTPILVVVTDLASGHASWYDTRAAHVTVPTATARHRAIACGVHYDFVTIAGVPISPKCVAVPGERAALRSHLGWDSERPTILLAGGGEGLGGLEAIALAIDAACLPCDLAVVAGRNRALAARLRATPWSGTVHVYDFVDNFAELLRAAAALITKAGPGTISEACACGCPLILCDAIPGQETGNVAYVVDQNAGVWAPSPVAVTTALEAWLLGRDASASLRRASIAAARIAKPHAAREIAGIALTLAQARHQESDRRSLDATPAAPMHKHRRDDTSNAAA